MKQHSVLFMQPHMETSTSSLFFFFFSFFFSFTYTALSINNCPPLLCTTIGPVVRFPFWLKSRHAEVCGYPGFDLSCNNRSQLLLNLPSSGEFIVTNIDYTSQIIYIRPQICDPKSILYFSPLGSPFNSTVSHKQYTFYNCSSSGSSNDMFPAEKIDCLSEKNHTVIAMPAYPPAQDLPSTCRNISTVEFPVPEYIQDDLQLVWNLPNCRSCELKGETCERKSDTNLEIGCANRPTNGLPRSAKYGIIVGVGIPGLVFIIGLVSFIGSKIRAYGLRRHLNADLSTTTINPQPAIIVVGLDGATIESYPKIVLGESKRLPKPSDGTCSICLSEYQPKDTLRTIPECNHYFHASCIDEWLGLNATCPVCRNTPEDSSMATPCSSISSSTTSSSS